MIAQDEPLTIEPTTLTLSQSAKQTTLNINRVKPATAKLAATSALGFTRADFYLLLCISLWAFNGPVLKGVLEYIDPLVASVIRNGVAGLIFLGLTWFQERSLAIKWQHVGLLVVCAVVGLTMNQLCFVFALKNATASEVSLLAATTPIFATVAAWAWGHDKIGANFWYSLPISLIGVALIILTAPGVQINGSWLGDLLAIGTAAAWAIHTILLRPLLQHYSVVKLSAYVSLISTLSMLPFSYGQIQLDKLATLPINIWVSLAFCTIGAVVLTNVLWYTGVKRLGAVRTTVYAYLQPFIGVVMAFLVLSETIVPWQIVGGGVVIAGLVIYRQPWVKTQAQ
jgi:drug/metabolite transporter (DMT)-like permease